MARVGVRLEKFIAGRKDLAIPICGRADLSAYGIATIGERLRWAPAGRLGLHSLFVAADCIHLRPSRKCASVSETGLPQIAQMRLAIQKKCKQKRQSSIGRDRALRAFLVRGTS